MKRFLVLLSLPFVFAACDSSTDGPCADTGDCIAPPSAVIVGNQGNFEPGDGSVSVYDLEREETTEPISNLMSIVQSVASLGGRLYVAANTGGRVEVYSADTYQRVGSIEVENPRYIASDGERLYVTKQLYDRPSEVAVVDATTLEVVQTIEVGGFAEGIVVVGDRVFVATGAFGATQEVVVIDTATDEVEQRIDVGCTAPRSLLLDPFDPASEVWVFCGGSADAEGEVVVLDVETGEVADRIAIDGRIDTAGPGQDAFASEGDVFAVRDQDTVLRFDAESNTLAGSISAPGGPIGAVAVSSTGQIYLGRVPGFDVRGSVTIHEEDGTQIGEFVAGAAPTSITFSN